jgi:hypothetical protein
LLRLERAKEAAMAQVSRLQVHTAAISKRNRCAYIGLYIVYLYSLFT